MKKIVAMILTGVLLLNLVGCSNSDIKSNEDVQKQVEAETRVVVDHSDNEVEVPAQIDRIVVGTWPIAAQLAAYLGSAEKIVGVAPEVMAAAEHGLLGTIYPEFLNASTDFYQGGTINVEELLKLEPDIVIGVSGEAADSIRAAGIPVVEISVSDWNYDVVTTTEEWLTLFDDIFGESETTTKVMEYTKKVQADIAKKVATLSAEQKKKAMILFTYSDATMSTSSKGFFGQSWCDLTGVINVGEEIENLGSANINMEQVYTWNPDVIMITNFTSAQPKDLYNNTIGGDDWSSVAAVKNKEVYKMPLGIYRSFTPGVDTAITLQWFAKSVYPSLFEDVDMEQMTKEYFEECFEITLTKEQIEMMFHPSSDASAY